MWLGIGLLVKLKMLWHARTLLKFWLIDTGSLKLGRFSERLYFWRIALWEDAIMLGLVLERTVRCSRTVRFFVMFVMFEVWFWAKIWCSEVFEVRSCCYVTRLVFELTVGYSQTVRVFVMFDMFEVRFWAKMWCSESLMFWHSMFGVFEVRYFGVRSKTSLFHV